jgi:hypothetical protein
MGWLSGGIYAKLFTLQLVDLTGTIGLQMETPRIKPEEQEKPVFASPSQIVICA